MIPEKAAVPVTGCRDCRLGLDHCHQAFILHGNEEAECSRGPDCTAGWDLHATAIFCRELVPPCGC